MQDEVAEDEDKNRVFVPVDLCAALCQVPNTIVHELVHLTWKNMVVCLGGDAEKEPNGVADKCFDPLTCK